MSSVGSFDCLRDMAFDLIGEDGEAVTLRKMDRTSTADPTKPWRKDPPTPVDTSVTVAFVTTVGDSLRYEEGGQTRRGALLGLMGSSGVSGETVPDIGNQLIRQSGQVWTIKAIREHSPDGTVLLWELVLDK